MSEQPTQDPGGAPENEGLDPAQERYVRDRLLSEQSLGGGILAGTVAGLIGAILWAIVTVVTGYQIGFMAIGIGFLVGYGVRIFGKGIDRSFGFTGGLLALLACAAGNVLAACGMVARQHEVPFFQVLSALNLEMAAEMMYAMWSPIDLLFYGIAIYEGYKISFRQVTEMELKGMLEGSGGVVAEPPRR